MNPVYMNINRLMPLGLLRRIANINPLIVNYHVVSDESLPHIINLYKYRDVRTFIEDLDFFSANYSPVTLHALLDHLKNGTRLPRNSFHLTFDDGFREIYDIAAPLLLKKRIPATFFITWDFIDNRSLGFDSKKSLVIQRILSNTSLPERLTGVSGFANARELIARVSEIPYSQRTRIDEIASQLNIDLQAYLDNKSPYLTTHQIRDLIGQGFTIGSHALDHANFSELTLEDQVYQAGSSMDRLCERFSLNYRVFAFPYSDKGISASFFTRIAKQADLTFGNQGLLRDDAPINMQRMSVEKTGNAAVRITKYQYIKYIYSKIIRKNNINRNKHQQ